MRDRAFESEPSCALLCPQNAPTTLQGPGTTKAEASAAASAVGSDDEGDWGRAKGKGKAGKTGKVSDRKAHV